MKIELGSFTRSVRVHLFKLISPPWSLRQVGVALVVILATLMFVRPFPPFQNFENTRRVTDYIAPKELTRHATDRPFLVLCFSGGGVRASALAYFVLKELAAMRYQSAGTEHQLINDVRVISAVSGGSVTAAYLALNGSEHIDRLYDDFLAIDNKVNLLLTAANPVTLGRLLFSQYSRSDLLADYFDNRLFGGATFQSLRDPNRPLLILNATDIVDGAIFSFSPYTFDALCSDFYGFRIASAVAASAAFPVLFSPVTLKDYSGPDCPGWKDDSFVNGFEETGNAHIDRLLQYQYSLYHGPRARRDISYVHLMDGGLSDNLGLSMVEQLIRNPSVLGFPNYLDSEFPQWRLVRRGLVIIDVNARVSTESELDQRETAPGIGEVVRGVINLPMSSSSIRTQESIANLVDQINRRFWDDGMDFRKKAVWFFRVDLDDLGELCSKAFTRAVNAIPTSWSITSEQLRLLKVAAQRLMAQSSAGYTLENNISGGTLDREGLELCIGRPLTGAEQPAQLTK